MRIAALGVAVALAYVVAAQLGFRLAFVAEQVTTVWAPTGIALATLLLGGIRLWPAVWVGAFVANAGTEAPLWTAILVATGNTLEAVVASFALRTLSQFDDMLHRVADVVAFVGIAAFVCPTVSATIGVATLCAAGVQPWDRFTALFFDWWLGDALGALIVAPAILTSVRQEWSRQDWTRAVLFVSGSVLVTQLVFGQQLGLSSHPLEYAAFPVVIGAAVSGGPAVTALVVLSASAVSIWHTVHGSGPFAGPLVHQSLVLLQVFMGVLASTALLLAAAVAERQTSERRARSAAALARHREEMLRLAQLAGGVATFEWDFRNQVARCSPEFFRIFGLPQRTGEMTAAEWGEFVHPEDRDRMAVHLERALAGAEPAVADYRINAADGKTRWLSYAGQLQATVNGERVVGTVLDITERKQTELALQYAKTAAESANRLKDQFLATLSHELRTPLNVILGYARMLKTDAVAPENRRLAIDAIERNAAVQHQLVEDLLDMSRIATGRVRLDPQPVSVVMVLREALEGVRPAADAKGIVVSFDVDPLVGTVMADATRLQQVFWNLLTNAVKFTGRGGRISVCLHRDETSVEASVSDSGVGIASDFLPFVFEPFRQADTSLAGRHGGLGLGLAISKQLVELHGGTIQASSAGIGQGATFTIRLPRHH
jgi:PAS domain S-box-containing protein